MPTTPFLMASFGQKTVQSSVQSISQFNLQTGMPDVFPATQPVPVYPARIVEGDIEVELP